MKRQTAVEWLANEFYEKFKVKENDVLFNDLVNQAKFIEWHQIVNAHGNKTKLSGGITNYSYILTGEDYYNEQFKNK
jgi:hypothetical protein